jgi:hypothetical protein
VARLKSCPVTKQLVEVRGSHPSAKIADGRGTRRHFEPLMYGLKPVPFNIGGFFFTRRGKIWDAGRTEGRGILRGKKNFDILETPAKPQTRPGLLR